MSAHPGPWLEEMCCLVVENGVPWATSIHTVDGEDAHLLRTTRSNGAATVMHTGLEIDAKEIAYDDWD